MNREDIIRMARESGIKDLCGLETTGWPGDARVDALVQFAALVAAHEREACAEVAAMWDADVETRTKPSDAIRKRGEK